MKFSNSSCPVAAALTILNNPWKFLIIRSLGGGAMRFGKLKDAVTGISPKVLTNCLSDLVASGVITRTLYAEIPPRTEYELTELGTEMMPIISALAKWGMKYQSLNPAASADSAKCENDEDKQAGNE